VQIFARLIELTRGQATPGSHEQVKSDHFLAMTPERLAHQAFEKAAIDSARRDAFSNHHTETREASTVRPRLH